MSALGHMIKESITNNRIDARIDTLVSLPEWKFFVVFMDGLYNEPLAGTIFEGVYYDEYEIHIAYFERNPDADPLL
ncbi:MAG: hypothetical protein ACRCT2_05690 [Plesiomonas shigelloides]